MITNKELIIKSEKLRLKLLQLIHQGNTGHTGGDLSVLNLLTVLYNKVMNVDPANPKKADRDRFILSKGHCAEALYVVLCDRGFISENLLRHYGENYSLLGGHPTVDIPGVEINTGALGHGLSAGVGMALAKQMDGGKERTFVVMGDGEQAEGSIYEAMMAANKYHLQRLVAIIDRNHLQITGDTEDVMPIENIHDKWTSFGWDVIEMNGNDVNDIVRTFDQIDYDNGKPHLVISHTTKGLGVSFMENVAKWHHGVPKDEQYAQALREVKKRIAKAEME